MAGRREIEGEFIQGWADRKRPTPYTLSDADGRVISQRTPVADLEGLITPTDLRYVVVQLDAPDPVHLDDWSLEIGGEVDRPQRAKLARRPSRRPSGAMVVGQVVPPLGRF